MEFGCYDRVDEARQYQDTGRKKTNYTPNVTASENVLTQRFRLVSQTVSVSDQIWSFAALISIIGVSCFLLHSTLQMLLQLETWSRDQQWNTMTAQTLCKWHVYTLCLSSLSPIPVADVQQAKGHHLTAAARCGVTDVTKTNETLQIVISHLYLWIITLFTDKQYRQYWYDMLVHPWNKSKTVNLVTFRTWKENSHL